MQNLSWKKTEKMLKNHCD